MNRIVLDRLLRHALGSIDRAAGSLRPLARTLTDLSVKPQQLGLEFTNLCNANCVFCPYQHQERPTQLMSDEVFRKAVADFVHIGGGDIELTPVVGEALIHPDFIERVRYLRAQPGIGRIWLITNAILIDRHGVESLLDSGVTRITISTSGFDKDMYQRVYRSTAYERMRRNVLDLVSANARRGCPVDITISLRPDRPLRDVLRDPDFQPILEHHPTVHANNTYSDAGGRIPAADLPKTIQLRVLTAHPTPCAYTYYGPIVLSDGTVVVCSCLAAMDRAFDLGIGSILESSLLELWRSEKLAALRASFGSDRLNSTCSGCTMYHGVEEFGRLSAQRRSRANRIAFERSPKNSR